MYTAITATLHKINLVLRDIIYNPLERQEEPDMDRDGIKGTINYVAPPTGLALYSYTGPTSKISTNVNLDPRNILIHNARGRENDFILDVNGFQFLKHTSTLTDFSNEYIIKKDYYPEVKQLLKECTGADRIMITGHAVRLFSHTNELYVNRLYVHCINVSGMVRKEQIQITQT